MYLQVTWIGCLLKLKMCYSSSRKIRQPVTVNDWLPFEHDHHPNCHNGIQPVVPAATGSFKGDVREVFYIVLRHCHRRAFRCARLILVAWSGCYFPDCVHQDVVPIVGLQSIPCVEDGKGLDIISAPPASGAAAQGGKSYVPWTN